MLNREQLESFLPEGYVLVSPEQGTQATPLSIRRP